MDAVERVPVPVAVRAEAGTTNAYVVGADPAVLVDPAARTDALDRAVERRDPRHVVVTHAHPDHVGAVARYAEGRTVWSLGGYEERLVAAIGRGPDRTLREGAALSTGDGHRVVTIETPGHAPDHLALAVGDRIIAGDLLVEGGSVVVGAPEGDMRAYLTSLRRLYARDPDVLYPGHGSPIEDPRGEIERLLAHRRERERRVLAAVEAGAATPDAVVEAAYEKDLDGVRDLARATVVAHLEKLAVEGRLAWDGERARPN